MKVTRASIRSVRVFACAPSKTLYLLSMNERVCIFIDGANFYHLALKKLGFHELDFDFDAFALFLANGRIVSDMCKRIYIGTVREKAGDPPSVQAMAQQTSLFTVLRNAGWEIKTSKLKTRIEEIAIDSRVLEYQKIKKLGIQKITIERLREKGIDVKLATDLVVGAVDDKYDTAIVVSSDSDLIPAIDWVRLRRQKKIEYVGFSLLDPKNKNDSTAPLLSMISRTDVQRTLVESDLNKFIKPRLLS